MMLRLASHIKIGYLFLIKAFKKWSVLSHRLRPNRECVRARVAPCRMVPWTSTKRPPNQTLPTVLSAQLKTQRVPSVSASCLQFSSVQFKMVSMHSEKPILAPSRLSEVSPTMPWKQFPCLSLVGSSCSNSLSPALF